MELHILADELGLHELAVEDALGEHQRPKVDYYATHLFFACKAVTMDIGRNEARREGDRRVHRRAVAHHRS
jgi:Mg2+ and Co2+ transporter CorA